MKTRKHIPHNKHIWTDQEEKFLIDNYQLMSNRELAKELRLSLTLTRTKLYQMGFKRMDLEYWTDEQIAFLISNFRFVGDVELAEIFTTKWPKKKPWTKKHIEKKRKYLKLNRSGEEITAIHNRNVRKGRFKMCPVNAWKKRGVAGEGEIRYWSKCGAEGKFPVIKIGGRFVHYGPYRYTQLYGPISKGMNVIFADGNPYNLSDANLTLVSNAELSKINCKKSSIGLSDNYIAGMLTHNDPEARKIVKSMPELIELKRNQLKLNRAINNGTNENRK